MRVVSVVGALGLVCLLTATGWGQGGDVEALRRQVEALQSKLSEMEGGAKSDRVTQIGGTRARGREPELVVRIYDLGDLFAMAPPYEAKFDSDLKQEDRAVFPRPSIDRTGGMSGMGGMGGGGMGGGFFNVKEGKRTLPEASKQVLFQNANVKLGAGRASVDDLIETITATINPNIWDDVGGPASISSLGTSLIVSADEPTHEQIDALLELFRKRWGTLRTISVRAYWLWLTDEGLTALVPETKAGELPAFGLVDPGAWQKQLEAAAGGENARAGYRAALTCYNGQTVYSVSGAQSLAVTDIEPVVLKGDEKKPEGRVAYHPRTSVIHEGVALQVTPIASISGQFVVIDVHSRVVESRPADPKKKPAAAKILGGMGGVMEMPRVAAPSPADVVAVLDRPKLVAQRFSTTLRVPVGKPMLVGGMTFDNPARGEQANLYLFLNVSVQELRDDVKAAKPAAKKPPTKAEKK